MAAPLPVAPASPFHVKSPGSPAPGLRNEANPLKNICNKNYGKASQPEPRIPGVPGICRIEEALPAPPEPPGLALSGLWKDIAFQLVTLLCLLVRPASPESFVPTEQLPCRPRREGEIGTVCQGGEGACLCRMGKVTSIWRPPPALRPRGLGLGS